MSKVKKILIIDDSELDRAVLTKFAEKNGYAVITANDGPNGVDKARTEKPDFIFMDVVMPTLSGFETTRILRDDPLTKNIPVVICSNKNLKSDETWGMSQGAMGYIIKPIKEDDLITAITLLENR